MKIYKVYLTGQEKQELEAQLGKLMHMFEKSQRFPEASKIAYRTIDGIYRRLGFSKVVKEY